MIVADDGSRDATAAEADAARARASLRLPRRGKGQALTLAEREAPPGPLLLCDADLTGDLGRCSSADADLAIAAFAERQGGGFGIVKRAARELLRLRPAASCASRSPGQRALSPPRARERASRSPPASAARRG